MWPYIYFNFLWFMEDGKKDYWSSHVLISTRTCVNSRHIVGARKRGYSVYQHILWLTQSFGGMYQVTAFFQAFCSGWAFYLQSISFGNVWRGFKNGVCLILYDSSYTDILQWEKTRTDQRAVVARGWGQKAGWQLHNNSHLSKFKTVHWKGWVYGYTSVFLKVCKKKKRKEDTRLAKEFIQVFP